MVRNDGESNVVASISEVEHEWLNCPIDSFDHLLDDSLTEEQAEEIKKILERHRGLFSKKKGLTHLVEHRIVTGMLSQLARSQREHRHRKGE